MREPHSATIGDQVGAARQRALVLPAPEFAILVVGGRDRLSWLNGMLTCDLNGRVPGDAVYGLQVGLKGRVVSDVIVVVDEERAFLLVQRQAAEAVSSMLDRHLMMEDVVVEVASEGFFAWVVHGPRSGDVLAAARAAGAVVGPLDRTGLGGGVVVATEPRAGIAEALSRALSAVDGVFGDDDGWDALRLERAVPKFGVDFDEESYPQEAGLEKTAVSFSKGCYLGQEVVCMLELRGHVKKKLVPIVIDGNDVPQRGTPVFDAEQAVEAKPTGEITSATLSPALGKPVAFAMVKYARAMQGGPLRVGAVGARIIERPI